MPGKHLNKVGFLKEKFHSEPIRFSTIPFSLDVYGWMKNNLLLGFLFNVCRRIKNPALGAGLAGMV
jgi:hypothetical protein